MLFARRPPAVVCGRGAYVTTEVGSWVLLMGSRGAVDLVVHVLGIVL